MTIQNDCQTIWRTRRQSWLSSVPRPSIIVANVHEFLCVGSSALGQVRGSVPRRLHQNVNIASIQKIFTTAQSPIRNLHEDEFCGLTEEVDWTQSSQRPCSLIDQEIPQQLPAEVHHQLSSAMVRRRSRPALAAWPPRNNSLCPTAQRAARLNSSQHHMSSNVSHLQLAKGGLEISVDTSTSVSASIERAMRCL